MSYKTYIYAIMLLVSAFAFSGLNINSIFKTNHKIEAKVFIILMLMAVSYLAGSFIINVINLA